jgi:hypothetical protein
MAKFSTPETVTQEAPVESAPEITISMEEKDPGEKAHYRDYTKIIDSLMNSNSPPEEEVKPFDSKRFAQLVQLLREIL